MLAVKNKATFLLPEEMPTERYPKHYSSTHFKILKQEDPKILPMINSENAVKCII